MAVTNGTIGAVLELISTTSLVKTMTGSVEDAELKKQVSTVK